MSLKDQLLKAGLVTKKQAKAVELEQRKEQKAAQGNLEKARIREAREAERAAAEAAAKLEAQRLAKLERQRVRDAQEQSLRVRQLLKSHEIRAKGAVTFHHRTPSGVLGTLQVSSGVAMLLRTGRAAVAVEDHGNRVRYVVIPADVAERIRAVRPSAIAHWSQGSDEPLLAAPPRDWEPDLRARRATPEDIARFRAQRRGSG